MKNTFQVEGLSALVSYSPSPEILAEFYRAVLGIPLQVSDHGGSVGKHFELFYNGIHFAIWKGEPKASDSIIPRHVPTFRVKDMHSLLQHLEKNKIKALHKPTSLEERESMSCPLKIPMESGSLHSDSVVDPDDKD